MTVQNQKPQPEPSKKTSQDHPQTPAPKYPPNPKQAAVQPSGPNGGDPSTAGPGQTAVRSDTPENNAGSLNPSAPGDTGTTPGTNVRK